VLALVVSAACDSRSGSQVGSTPTGSGAAATACDVFKAHPSIVRDPYLLQIADRATDPAAATQAATDDPSGALTTRQTTLAALREASRAVSGREPLAQDLAAVIGAYEQNVNGLQKLVAGETKFLPVGASPDVEKPAQAVLDDAGKTCGVRSP
jgi:hypothetical protein